IDGLWSLVKHLEENRDRYEKALPGEADRGIQNARVAAQAARNAVSTFNYRDQCMAENAAWILDHAPKGSKLVLWAHNGHVCRNPGAMGSHLSKRLGKEQVIVGFAAGEGQYTAVATGQGVKKDNPLNPPPEGSLEGVCKGTGLDRFLLDLR